jgi:sterol 3beta-glucosyltransferase
MKITILTYGSLGDVLPYISLALGLNESGHEVTLAAPSNFEITVSSYGLKYRRISGDMKEILNGEMGKKWMATRNVISFTRALVTIFYRRRTEMQLDMLLACEDAEAIIAGSMLLFQAAMISEKLGLPLLAANINPVIVLTGAFPHFLVSTKKLPLKLLNQATYVLAAISYEAGMRDMMNKWRKDMGLRCLKGSTFIKMIKLKVPVVLGYSPDLLPRPAEWDSHIAVTGNWKLGLQHNKPYKPAPELLNWLKAGRAPIFFGFGSMPVNDSQRLTDMVKAICIERGARAIIDAGWSDVEITNNALTDPVYTIGYADLDWLFPQCSCIVHHGGAGTTHISLSSGIPTLICSVFADNAFWGERLEKLGAGKHIRYRDITKEGLMNALSDLEKDELIANARNLGEKIKAGNGLKNAVDFINSHLATAPVYVD